MSECKALIVNRGEDKSISHHIETIQIDDLPPDGDVLVAVEYSTVNYKDGLCLGGKGGLVRTYPHIPGIDFAGEVVDSKDSRYAPGDKVVLTGWRVGEIWWGGYAQYARVKADWLVPLPDGLTCQQAMAIGTAGITAMLSVLALERPGVAVEDGPILVTGAGGGVGSVATAVLASAGFEVAAVTGRPDVATYLQTLGAATVIDRDSLMDGDSKPLMSEQWAGCIDSVGSQILARVLSQMKFNAAVAAVGLAGGADLPTTVIPFIIRGVALLGIDSVMCPFDRRLEAWERLATDLPKPALDAVTSVIGLSDVPAAGADILAGRVRGRLVVDLSR